MTGKRNYVLLSVVVALGILMIAFAANAETKTIKGKLTGLTCLMRNFLCPTDKADPMINLERDFVLVTGDGKHYFLTNIGLGLKGKYALEVVEATGDVNEKLKAIKVEKLVKGGKVVWTSKMEEEMSKKLEEVGP